MKVRRPIDPPSSSCRFTSSTIVGSVGSPISRSKRRARYWSHSALRLAVSSSSGIESPSSLLGSFEKALHLAQDLGGGERLGDVALGPFLEADHLVAPLGARREHRDRDVPGLLVALQDLENLPAVHLRHHHVQENDVWRVLVRAGDGRLAVGRRPRDVTVRLEDELEERQDVLLVVDDQNALLLVRHFDPFRRAWRRSRGAGTGFSQGCAPCRRVWARTPESPAARPPSLPRSRCGRRG